MERVRRRHETAGEERRHRAIQVLLCAFPIQKPHVRVSTDESAAAAAAVVHC